ncbi:MAG: polyhydroxybutyrate depolymerase, partial [Pseudomonadota bacterium]
MRTVLALLALCLAGPVLGQSPCPMDAEACTVESGTYRLEWPEGDGPFPLLVFLHGAGSNGNAILKNRVLVETFLNGGMAVMAPDGKARPDSNRTSLGWSVVPNMPERR